MLPLHLATELEAEASALRRLAVGVRASGRPIDVPWGPAGVRSKPLHQLTSIDLDADADALDRDAAKLRKLYS